MQILNEWIDRGEMDLKRLADLALGYTNMVTYHPTLCRWHCKDYLQHKKPCLVHKSTDSGGAQKPFPILIHSLSHLYK